MKTVVLDPGHGGDGGLTTFGAVGNGLIEKEVNLIIARYCFAKLNEYDCRVIMTRDSDTDLSFTARANVARYNNADILVSFHLNGYHDVTANGFESFIYSGTLDGLTIGYQHKIHNKIFYVLAQESMRDRGKKRQNFAILRLPPCPCVLIEYGFITNIQDATAIKKPGMLKILGEQTALGIVEALGLEEKSIPWPVIPIPGIIRTIGIEHDGKRTNEVGFLARDPVTGLLQTYVRAGFAAPTPKSNVVGKGDYIQWNTEK